MVLHEWWASTHAQLDLRKKWACTPSALANGACVLTLACCSSKLQAHMPATSVIRFRRAQGPVVGCRIGDLESNDIKARFTYHTKLDCGLVCANPVNYS